MSDMAKNILLWLVIAVVLMSVFNNFTTTRTAPRSLTYSTFIEQVKQGTVRRSPSRGVRSRVSPIPASVFPLTVQVTMA